MSFSELTKVSSQSDKYPSFGLEKTNARIEEIHAMASRVVSIQVIETKKAENSQRLGSCEQITTAQLSQVDAIAAQGKTQDAEIQALAAPSFLSEAAQLIPRVAACFNRCCSYACPVLGTGAVGAVALGLGFQTALAASLGALGGGCLGGTAFYLYSRVRGYQLLNEFN